MQYSRRLKKLGILVLAGLVLGVVFVWHMGTVLVAPSNRPVGDPPPDLHATNVEFSSLSGATIHGWFIAGQPGRGAVVLMHGVHSDRRSLEGRAGFLSKAGYAVLLFDFQAHGESQGDHITYGYLESRDAAAAVQFIRQRLPGEKVGVIGISMGAAAALLANPPLPVDAMVLESSFPTIYQAAEDRMINRFGWLGELATPLLTCQLKPRLDITVDDLRPIESVKNVLAPKFFIAGTADHNTTIEESRALYAAAPGPKECWWLDGAGHVNMHDIAGKEYEKRILVFLKSNLDK